MIDFKKKKKGFLSLFESDGSKFETLWVGFLVDRINDVPEWSLSKFPKGLKGKEILIPKSFVSNFPEKHRNSTTPLIKKISNNSEIHISELLEQLVFFSNVYDGSDDKREWFESGFEKLKTTITSVNLSAKKWLDMFEEFSKYYADMVFHDDSPVPSVSVLFHKEFLKMGQKSTDNFFRTYCLMTGYHLIFGAPICSEIVEEMDAFFVKHAPEEAEKSGCLQPSNYAQSLSDLNQDYINRVVEFHLDNGFFTEKYINKTLEKNDLSEYEDGYSVIYMIDLFELILVYNGQTLNQAKKNKDNLVKKLNKISSDWVDVYHIFQIISHFTSYNWFLRLKMIPFVKKKLINLLYVRA
jgi:hypothetical protein